MTQNEIDETRGRLVRSASTITPLTLVSRVTGYLRDKVIAVTLGAGLRTDAFFVAFRIPNMLREIIGEGAMSSAVIPVYAGVSDGAQRGAGAGLRRPGRRHVRAASSRRSPSRGSSSRPGSSPFSPGSSARRPGSSS